VCARDTCGMATAAAPVMAAPARNLRRVVDLDVRDSAVMGNALLRLVNLPCGILLEPLGCMNRPDGFPIPVDPVVGRGMPLHKARIVSPRRLNRRVRRPRRA